jgi:hypothetical protein
MKVTVLDEKKLWLSWCCKFFSLFNLLKIHILIIVTHYEIYLKVNLNIRGEKIRISDNLSNQQVGM